MVSGVFIVCACLAATAMAKLVPPPPPMMPGPLPPGMPGPLPPGMPGPLPPGMPGLPPRNPFKFPSPTYNSCPLFLPYAPFALLCDCNLASCFNEALGASLVSYSERYSIRLCIMQQWAAIIQNTMPDIPIPNLEAMADQIALAFRKEMDRQRLDFRPYPEFCNYMHIMDTPGGPMIPEPVLEKRAVDVLPPNAPLSPEAMEVYTNNLYYYLHRALPSLPSSLNHDLLQAIYRNTPPGYLPLADDLFLKLKMNMQVMLSMMNDYVPFIPGPILY